MKSTQNGFTIVELLIVVVVIGILAGISIVAYNGIQERARLTLIKSELNNAAKRTETYRTLDSPTGNYPNTFNTLSGAYKGMFARDTTYRWLLYCGDSEKFTIAAFRPNSTWWIVDETGEVRQSTVPGTTGNDGTTCGNLGFTSPFYSAWMKSNAGWSTAL